MNKPDTVNSMKVVVECYLEERRSLGFKSRTDEYELGRFARYADERGHSGSLTQELGLIYLTFNVSKLEPFS